MSHDDPRFTRRAILAGGAALAAMPIIGSRATPAFAESPILGPLRPSVYRNKLGDFEITTILDGLQIIDAPYPGTFGQNQPEADVKKFAADNLLPDGKLENPFTPVIVNTGKEVILFDSGSGPARRPNAGRLTSLLEQAGLKADQIDIVVITHCHVDHIGGLTENGQPTFPKARYVIGQAEYDFWSHQDRLSGPTEANAKVVQTNVVAYKDKMTFLKPGQDIVTGITSLDVAGHTPGMLGFNVESQGRRLILTADTVNHAVMSLRRPDWHVRFDMDKEKGVATRVRMLDMLAADKVPFAGYHMPFPAIGYVDKSDGGYRWVAHTYQLHI